MTLIPVFFYLILGWALFRTQGFFHIPSLWLVSLGWVSTTIVFFKQTRLGFLEKADPRVGLILKAILFVFLGLLVYSSRIFYVQDAFYDQVIHFLLVVVALLLAMGEAMGKRVQSWIGWVSLGLLFLAKVFTLYCSHHPKIDVFTCNTEAVRYFLNGLNPYSQKYTDIYGGFFDYPPGFVYWPAVLYFQTFAYSIFGDIRWSFIIAEGVNAVALVSVMKTLGLDTAKRRLILLLWFSFPLTFMILANAWVDTYLILFFTLILWGVLNRRWVLVGVFIGVFCAIKQYAVLAAVLTAIFLLRIGGWRNFLKASLAAGITFGLLVGPFLLKDFEGFYFSTIYTPLMQSLRADSLSIPALFLYKYKYRLGGQWLTFFGLASLGLGIGILGLSLSADMNFRGRWRGSRSRKQMKNQRSARGEGLVGRFVRNSNLLLGWLAAIVSTYGGIFLFGKQAFCNYYYLLAYFLLVFIAVRLARTYWRSEGLPEE